MVTATNGTATFIGPSGKKLIDFYISDVVGAAVTWNRTGAAVAGSDTFIRFDEPVVLTDLSIVTGPTVMVGLYPSANGATVNDGAVRIANYLNSINLRQPLKVGFQASKNIKLIQF